MKHWYLFILMLFIALPANAESPVFSGDSLHKLYAEMLYLYQTGITIHQRYDPSERDQMKECSSEWGYVSTRAKSLIGIANRIQHPNKEQYINAGWAALNCVKCTTKEPMCDPIIPETLKQLREELSRKTD